MARRNWLAGGALGLSAAVLVAPAQAHGSRASVYVQIAPPAVQHAPVPRHGRVWVPGQWVWQGHGYAWVPGHFVVLRPRYRHAAPTWPHHGSGWGYDAGGWHPVPPRHFHRRDRDRDGIPDRYDRDLDNDGRPNHRDWDRDGDGVPNHRDGRPDNWRRY